MTPGLNGCKVGTWEAFSVGAAPPTQGTEAGWTGPDIRHELKIDVLFIFAFMSTQIFSFPSPQTTVPYLVLSTILAVPRTPVFLLTRPRLLALILLSEITSSSLTRMTRVYSLHFDSGKSTVSDPEAEAGHLYTTYHRKRARCGGCDTIDDILSSFKLFASSH